MKNQILKVESISPVEEFTRNDGTPSAKRTVVLQDVDGYGDTFITSCFGDVKNMNIQVGDIVVTSIRFTYHEYEGKRYQDVFSGPFFKIGDTVKF